MADFVSVAEFRQNPTPALDAVEEGRTVVITRHNRAIAELRPVGRRTGLSPKEFVALMDSHSGDTGWAAELADQRAEDFDDPWEQ